MKNINDRVVKVNISMFILLAIIVAGLLVYRFMNPTPPLEEKACMDNLNSLAVFQAKIHARTEVYSDKLNKLSRDGKLHYFHKCPVTDQAYIVISDSMNYTISCERHGLFIKNGILHKK